MKVINTSGTRKCAIARATLRPGNGLVRINSTLLRFYEPAMSRALIEEPLILAGDSAKQVDISVRVSGGGPSGQAQAARLAISKALAGFDKRLQRVFLDYDRNMLVADVRLKETRKPNTHGKARSKRQKSYR